MRVVCHQQMLESTANLMKRAATAEANGMALEEITDYRLHETMLPFSFQLSVWHHSYAVRGMHLFMPNETGIDYGTALLMRH